jgi:hypothetical protein
METQENIIIDNTNFFQYFRDCKISRPEKGDVLARWTGIAEFIDGRMKQDIIDLLLNKENKVQAAIQVMRKLGGATEKEAIRVCKEISKDILAGMSLDDVEKKCYSYQIELFYYTKPQYIPQNDKHWSLIGLDNLDNFLDQSNERYAIKSKIIENTNVEAI